MDIFVDGNRVEEKLDEGNLGDTLRHVQSAVCPPERIVVGIRCDGTDLSGEAMPDALQKPVSDFSRVDVVTGTKASLVVETMTHASAALQATENACARVVDQLTQGDTQEAADTLSQCLRTWQQIHDAVGKSIAMLELDPTQTTVNEQPILDLITQPKDALLQIKQALQAHDYVRLADVLQYEFGEVTDNWFSLIARLRQEAEDRAKPD